MLFLKCKIRSEVKILSFHIKKVDFSDANWSILDTSI